MDKLAKKSLKVRLREIGRQVLRNQGWKVEKIPQSGKSSVRRITKGRESLVVSIRTTQDQWIAFPPTDDRKKWVTLSDVDVVIAVSVDDPAHPAAARVHWLDGNDMRDRFDRAEKARREAGYEIPDGRRGVWIPLYIPEDGSTVRYVGGGAATQENEIARVALDDNEAAVTPVPPDIEPPLTIAEAKRRLARTFGVPESGVKIAIEA
jgi:hypothetical protein